MTTTRVSSPSGMTVMNHMIGGAYRNHLVKTALPVSSATHTELWSFCSLVPVLYRYCKTLLFPNMNRRAPSPRSVALRKYVSDTWRAVVWRCPIPLVTSVAVVVGGRWPRRALTVVVHLHGRAASSPGQTPARGPSPASEAGSSRDQQWEEKRRRFEARHRGEKVPGEACLGVGSVRPAPPLRRL